MNVVITEKQFKNLISENFLTISRGVRLSPEETKKINDLVPYIKLGKEYETNIEVLKDDKKTNIEINLKKLPPDSNSLAYFGLNKNFEQQITFNLKLLKDKPQEEIRKVLYHEITHFKDPTPSFVKQTKKGEPYITGSGTQYLIKSNEIYKEAEKLKNRIEAGEPLEKEYEELMQKYRNSYKKYQFSSSEITANNQMIINNLVSTSNDIINQYGKEYGKKRVIGMLNNILDFLKGKSELGKQGKLVFGEIGNFYFEELKKFDIEKYQSFVKKLVQQIEDIKTQF